MTTSFEPEWRSKPLAERLSFVYTNRLYTDIDILVTFDSKKYRYKAHKNILAYFSSVFEEMFYGNAAKAPSYIKFENMDPQGVSCVLECLYHVPPSPIKDIDKSILLSAYHTAQILGMTDISTGLRGEIYNYLVDSVLITKGDFWKLLELSHILNLKDVEQTLLKFAECNTREILKARCLPKASPTTMKQVLDLNILNVSEVEVLESILRWKKANSGLPFVDEFVKDLLGCVRFRNLSPTDFCQFIAKKNALISSDDALQILMHLLNPSSYPLPFWCSTKFRRFSPSSSEDYVKVQTEVSLTKDFEIQRSPSSLLKLFTEELYTDVCFLVGPDKIPIKAHRNILAVGSLVFHKMFFGPLPDTRYEIKVLTMNLDGFKIMLRYFYDESNLDDLFHDNRNLAVKTYDVALKYGSNTLKNICLKYMTPKEKKLKSLWTESLKSKQNFQKRVNL